MGVVELALAVVSAADEGGGEGVPGPRGDASGALIEVARVLVEDRGENGCAEHAADEDVAVVGAVTLGITFGSLAIIGVGVAGLLDAGEEAGGEEGDGIDGERKARRNFCFGLSGAAFQMKLV